MKREWEVRLALERNKRGYLAPVFYLWRGEQRLTRHDSAKQARRALRKVTA